MTRALLSGALAAGCLIAAPALAQPPAAQPPASPQKPADKPASKPDDAQAVTGVTVSGARKEIETSIDRRSYSVANDLQGKTGAIADVLRNVPSVQVDVNGNVSLRGDPNVAVYLDGRPSALLSKETLAQVLQTLPADQIDRIEVITNPSAEFRADGSAGIINLVTKKAKGAGKTGSVRAGVQSTGGAQGSLTRGVNSEKLSHIESLAFIHQRIGLDGLTTSVSPDPVGGDIERRDVLDGKVEADGLQGRVSMDYDVSKKTRLTLGLTGALQQGTQTIDEDFVQTNGAGQVIQAFERHSPQDIEGASAQADLNLRQVYGDQHDLNMHASLGANGNEQNRVDTTTPGVPPGSAFRQQVFRSGDNIRGTLSADFQKPLANKVQLKTGYLFEYLDNQIGHQGGFAGPTGPIISDPTQTDLFADTEAHHQAYATAQKAFGKTQVLAGLRGELVHLDLDQRTLNTQNEQDYGRLYPTLHLERAIGPTSKLTASYSKRVQRPGPPDLDPFRYTASSTAAIEGNPDLKPQETDSFEAGFETRKGQSATLATVYYRETDNAFSAVITDIGNGVLLQRRENAGRQVNAGVELVRSDRLTPKITYNLSANIYYTEIEAPNLGFMNSNSATTAFGRANLNWQLTAKDFVQINVFANSKQVLPQGYTSPVVSGNFGYRRNINDKVSLMFVLQDPFNSLTNKLYLVTPTGKETRVQHADSRVASLTLVWNFAGKPRDTGFDFAPGGAGASSVPQ